MKSIFTIALAFACTFTFAQDKVFVHTADGTNTGGHITTLTHPDLDGNPSANIIVTHNLNNGGVQYNDNINGTWYDGGNWTIFNEDFATMVDGASFNVYIPQGGKLVFETATGTSYTTVIDDPAINDDPNAVIVYSNYWNPNSVYNPRNYGFWYDDGAGRWNIFTEDLTNAPANATFALLVDEGTGGATAFYHTATAGNTPGGNYTIIDHPSLNGNPDAFPVVSHNWGTTGDDSNIVIDATLGVWYNGSNWTIYTEDTSPMPVDAKFNIYVAQSVLATETPSVTEVRVYPNPAHDILNVQASQPIGKVEVFNVLGQSVSQFDGEGLTLACDISGLAAGSYIAKITSGTSIQYKKIVKR
jgi:hypothetical protein